MKVKGYFQIKCKSCQESAKLNKGTVKITFRNHKIHAIVKTLLITDCTKINQLVKSKRAIHQSKGTLKRLPTQLVIHGLPPMPLSYHYNPG